MRIEFLVCVAVIFAMNLGGCSQPEPVVSSYAPRDCLCEEEVAAAAKATVEVEPAAAESDAAAKAKPVEVLSKEASEQPAVSVSDSTLARAACAELLRLNTPQKQSRRHKKNKSAKGVPKSANKPAIQKPTTPKPAPIADSAPAPAAPTPTPADPTRIDLNTATLAQLIGLPGVGPALAGRILDYRQKRRFGKPAHLMRVKGIGKAKYAKIATLVAVSAD